jgi:hypothetical protein
VHDLGTGNEIVGTPAACDFPAAAGAAREADDLAALQERIERKRAALREWLRVP